MNDVFSSQARKIERMYKPFPIKQVLFIFTALFMLSIPIVSYLASSYFEPVNAIALFYLFAISVGVWTK